MKMLCYYRINISEGIDVSETSTLKECIICHYCYFLDKNVSFNDLFVIAIMMY